MKRILLKKGKIKVIGRKKEEIDEEEKIEKEKEEKEEEEEEKEEVM